MILCGVSIPHTRSLQGHSDADVGLHALTDALLGTIGDGDIGMHFPPSDDRWRGASSDIFLKAAADKVRARGGEIVLVDVTLLCEAPRIGPYRDPMRHPHRRNPRHRARAGEHQGHHKRRPRLCRPRRGHRGDGDGHGSAAVTERIELGDDLVAQAEAVLAAARATGDRITAAESCTGGLVAAALTAVPGSSDVFDRGFVTYSNTAKSEMLGVPYWLIEKHGAVSEEVARAMAGGALTHSSASLAVAVTGIAGPSGGTVDKPVGLVHFAAGRPDGPMHHERVLFGDLGRAEIRRRSVERALALLRAVM